MLVCLHGCCSRGPVTMKQRHSNNYICPEIPGITDFLLNNQCKGAESTHITSFVSLVSKDLAV